MEKRTTPFGYKYENGVISIELSSADIVKEIFKQYINGSSMLQISDLLNKLHIEYRPGVIGWNKARIKRIIDDKRYIGCADYPRIINEEIAQKAKEMKESRNLQKNIDKSKVIYQLRTPVICPHCGNIMKRHYEPRITIHERWRCQSSNCKKVVAIPDKTLFSSITELLNMLINNPDIIQVGEKHCSISVETSRIQNTINRMMDNGHKNKIEIKDMIFKSASMKYHDINSERYEMLRLRDLFVNKQPVSEFPVEFLNRTVQAISFDKGDIVIITLINGQIIRKESTNGTAEEKGQNNCTDYYCQRIS